MEQKIKTGIAGSAGYTGGELIRLLLNHPNVEIVCTHSKSQAGRPVSEVHTDLLGETGLRFSSALPDDMDVLFLCVGHGEAKKFLETNKIGDKTKIIDLSQDHRVGGKGSHALDRGWVYGLPELNGKKIKNSKYVANPGCFATCIQLALLPLAAQGMLKEEVHVSATTGSTGAGQSLSETSHFSWRHNNLGVYKSFTHQHLAEIGQSLRQLQPGFSQPLNFIPYRGSFTRGILASVYTNCDLDAGQIKEMYNEYYKLHPFVFVSNSPVDLKQVVNTNKCLLSIEKHENKLLVVSVIDNLLKGASGQAVQNMNLMCGLNEAVGLKLKAVAF